MSIGIAKVVQHISYIIYIQLTEPTSLCGCEGTAIESSSTVRTLHPDTGIDFNLSISAKTSQCGDFVLRCQRKSTTLSQQKES